MGLSSRVRSLVLACSFGVIALSVAACGGDDDDAAGDSGNPADQATATATRQADDDEDSAADDFVASIEDAYSVFPQGLTHGYFLGDPGAPLTITIYEDFQCPFCLNYTANVEPALIADYVVDGDVRLHFQNFPILGPESARAAVAAECAAEQDLFWPLHHQLFALQAREGQHIDEQLNVGRFSDEALGELAAEAGLDMAAYETCFADPDTLLIVQDQASAARAAGITGTPGVLFNDTAIGGNPGTIDIWRQAIEAALDQLASE